MRGLKSTIYRCPRLMGIYSPRFERATPAITSSLFSSRSAAAQRLTDSRISRRNFSSWLFLSKVFRAVRISPDLVAIPSSLRSFSICSSSFFETAIAPITHLIIKVIMFFIKHPLSEVNGSRTRMLRLYRRTRLYVYKMLKGAKPADLPVEQPTKSEPVINLKTVKQIGLTIPQSVLYRADKVIR
ncbi:MAG: hypothetical protein HY695_34680 [Deltaproteobacteria bacterium]|nr:hypothetical protein [Deltaproteobacteria bacterium]